MDSTPQTLQIKPGDVFNIHNGGNVAQRVTLTTAAGTHIAAVLPPGADVVVTAGNEALGIHLEPLDPHYRGLASVD